MRPVNLTIIIDDINGAEQGYLLSYGFAALIELNSKKILFDTGTKVAPLLHNLETYGISPAEIDAIILSHNHFDHTNGLSGILSTNKDVPVYIHKDWERIEKFRGFQVPESNIIVNQKARECTEITKGLNLTNSHVSNDYGGVHEHASYIKIHNGYLLLCGCCHPGLISFLNDRNELGIHSNENIIIIGGLHGFRFQDSEVAQFNSIISNLILCHCTMNGSTFFKQFGNKCTMGIVGKTLTFE